MERPRPVELILSSKATMDGAGVRLNRVFGFSEVPRFDPFLLLDDFGSDNPDDYIAGFPWHPHRGIETVTYMLEGEVEHSDSLGNEGVIGSGDIQWMTAGSGIIHQEMPRRVEGRMRGFQLWVNLPASNKMMTPRYQEFPAAEIPVVEPYAGVSIKVIAGEVGGTHGPVRDVVAAPEYLDITVDAGSVYEHPTPVGHTAFIYGVEGEAVVGSGETHTVAQGQVALLGDGNSVRVAAQDQAFRYLLVSGKPLGEPVAWQGPIVMNSQGELKAAFREYRDGTFVKG
jgi:redox-sensitive bicupin YhaK (pirin superfamily)